MRTNPQETGDLFKFTKETLNGKLQFLCSVYSQLHIYNKMAWLNENMYFFYKQ